MAITYDATTVKANIARLEVALSRGELTVEYSDRRVTYRSVEELRSALAYWKAILADVEGDQRPKQSFAVASKGF